jgi:hypothetical protein
MAKARADLEDALTRIVRLSRGDDKGHLFIQDWVVAVSSESMEPGQENFSFSNFISRVGMTNYQVVGLHNVASHYWLNDGRHG